MVNFFVRPYNICFISIIIVKRCDGNMLSMRDELDSFHIDRLHIALTCTGPDSCPNKTTPSKLEGGLILSKARLLFLYFVFNCLDVRDKLVHHLFSGRP